MGWWWSCYWLTSRNINVSITQEIQVDSESAVETDFKARQLSYIDAIARLQSLGVDPQVAERRVCEWDDQEEEA